MIRYASSEDLCRNVFLLGYFGELKSPRCGRCDVCVGKKELKPGSPGFIELQKALVKALEDGGMDLDTLLDAMETMDADPPQVITVVEYLIESGILLRTKDLKIALK